MSSLRILLFISCVTLMMMMGGAVERYDEVLPGDMELMYQDFNYIDTGPTGSEMKQEDPIRSILLYKMLNSLRSRDVSPSILSGPTWIAPSPMHPDGANYPEMKGPILKRISDLASIKPVERPQQKWKIKKGKAGSQMICYFKLCAFRPPV